MEPAENQIKSRWVALIVQQVALFAIGAAFILSVRALTGRTLRNVEDPPGPFVLGAYIILLALVVGGTWWLYRRFAGCDAPPLGLALSARRLLELAAGFVLGALVNAAPWALSLLAGRAQIVEQIWDVVTPARAAAFVATGLLIALLNALPRRGDIARLPDPPLVRPAGGQCAGDLAAFFALQHLVAEGPEPMRLLYLWSLGILFGAAYVVRGHIWLACGLHMGYFWISMVPQGRWHAGSLIQIAGSPVIPWTAIDIILALAALGVLVWFGWRRARV